MPPATSTDGPTTHTSDHVVIGGGVLGAATARALAARGERVLLLEQHDRGHVHGSSHGGSRIFRMGYPDADYVDLTLRAWDAWAALESASGRTLLDHTGAVDHGRPEVVEARRSRAMVGSATFRTELSSISNRKTADRPANGSQAARRPAGGETGVVGGEVRTDTGALLR